MLGASILSLMQLSWLQCHVTLPSWCTPKWLPICQTHIPALPSKHASVPLLHPTAARLSARHPQHALGPNMHRMRLMFSTYHVGFVPSPTTSGSFDHTQHRGVSHHPIDRDYPARSTSVLTQSFSTLLLTTLAPMLGRRTHS